jgi:hypothetical protein
MFPRYFGHSAVTIKPRIALRFRRQPQIPRWGGACAHWNPRFAGEIGLICHDQPLGRPVRLNPHRNISSFEIVTATRYAEAPEPGISASPATAQRIRRTARASISPFS